MAMVNEDKKKDNDLLLKIYENLVRTDEKLRGLIENNRLEHDKIISEIKDIISTQKELDKRIQTLEREGAKILQDKITGLGAQIKDLLERVDKLEIEGVKMSIFWKILVIVGPIAASVLINYLMKILAGGS